MLSARLALSVGTLLRSSKVATTVLSTARKGIRLGLVAGLVVTGLVGVTSLTASGTGPAGMVHYGTLELTLTDQAGTLTLKRPDAAITQELGVATPCSTVVIKDSSGEIVPSNQTLLNFSAAVVGSTGGNVQLPSDGLGVTDGANCGEPAGRIGPGQTLTLALGDFLPDDVKIGDGTLQIGKSRGTDGSLKVQYDGTGGFGSDIDVAVGGKDIPVAKDGGFKSISLQSTATQSSRGLSLRTKTVFNLVTPAAVPGAPTNVTAVGGNAQADVSWNAPQDDGGSPPVTYELQYYDTSEDPDTRTYVPVELDSPTALSQLVIPLTNGTEYIFEVRAVTDAGNSAWISSNRVTPATAPGAPTEVTAVGGAVRTTVSWKAPQDDGGSPPVTYELRYYDTSNPDDPRTYTVLTVVPATATSQDVTGLTTGKEYVFEVRAVTDAGESVWVPSSAVTIDALPVNCGGTVQVDGKTGDIADKVVFLRGENEDKPGENVANICKEVDATVKIVSGDTDAPEGVTDYVFWNNTFEDVDGKIQRVNATVTIDWAPVLAADAAVLNRLIDYDGPTGPALYRETLWCESFAQTSATPVTYNAILPDWTYNTTEAEAIAEGAVMVDGRLKAPWCLVSDTRVQVGGFILQTEVLFGSGDPSRTGSFK